MNNKNQLSLNEQLTEFLIYTTPNWDVKVDVFLKDENLWLTQDKIAELFWVQRPAITKHLKNIFTEEELKENSVSSILEHTASDWKTYKTKFYNLDAIIAVWYRVNSKRATQFRIWSNKVVNEYIIKWFVMNDERLKDPKQNYGKDYFEEQLARIRDIRSSERRFYQKITDIYAKCSIDYDPKDQMTKDFFATVQNKLHYAITGQTAAEIIHSRIDSKKKNIWLTTWKHAPRWEIRKEDACIAKNYLNEEELDSLNRIVTMYLDYADLKAMNKVAMKMKDWTEKLNAFLKFNEKEVLQDKWKISHEVAVALAEKEYDKYWAEQDKLIESDFDRYIKDVEEK